MAVSFLSVGAKIMDDDYISPLPEKTYISPSLTEFGGKERRIRIASKILPSQGRCDMQRENK